MCLLNIYSLCFSSFLKQQHTLPSDTKHILPAFHSSKTTLTLSNNNLPSSKTMDSTSTNNSKPYEEMTQVEQDEAIARLLAYEPEDPKGVTLKDDTVHPTVVFPGSILTRPEKRSRKSSSASKKSAPVLEEEEEEIFDTPELRAAVDAENAQITPGRSSQYKAKGKGKKDDKPKRAPRGQPKKKKGRRSLRSSDDEDKKKKDIFWKEETTIGACKATEIWSTMKDWRDENGGIHCAYAIGALKDGFDSNLTTMNSWKSWKDVMDEMLEERKLKHEQDFQRV